MNRLLLTTAAVGVVWAVPALAQTPTVQIDGSSTVFPITEAFAEEFQNEHRGTYQVTVGVSGTGGGFKRFCRGETDISNASRPIRQIEMDECGPNGIEFIELPIALDALAVMVNPQNDWVDYLTVEELKKIWEPEAQGVITNWNQVREGFPDRPLTLYGAGVDSGTYDYFTLAVVGEEHASRGDFTASEDDNILVQGIAGDPNALGFFGLAYLEENRDKLKPVPIVYEGGEPVLPEAAHAADGSYQPLSRPIFIYVNAEAAQKEHVAAFINYYLDGQLAQELVTEVGYVPLPTEAYDQALAKFKAGKTGTIFGGGSKVGVSIDDLVN